MHQRPWHCPTPLSRLDLLHALATGKVNIDAYQENTPDKAEQEGHYYSDKAPGTVALALPAFAVAAGFLSVVGILLDSKTGWLFSSWVACAGCIGVIAALGGGTLFAWLSKQVPAKYALITTLALFLGAAPLPYATMMFSHALVVGLLAIALWTIWRQTEQPVNVASPVFLESQPSAPLQPLSTPHWERKASEKSARCSFPFRNRWDLLAGHVCGWALASEYTAGIVVIGIFVWLMSTDWRRAIPFCIAAVPPLLLIPAYSWLCFGQPFILPYSLQASFPPMKEGLYAIKWPSAETAFNLIFSPTRGLFFWTPFLLMAGVGYWKLATNSPRLFWLTYAVPLVQIIVISGRTWDWQAGPTLGPRFLAPILPLLALPCALGVQRLPKLGILLAGYSIAITTLATLTNACPQGAIYNPLTELHIPLFLKGEFSPNLGMALGLPPFASLALYYAILIGGIWWLWKRLPSEITVRDTTNSSR